jgi:hypothetical protein
MRNSLAVLEAGNGEQDVVVHARPLFGGQQVPRRGAEHGDDFRFVLGPVVGRLDDSVDPRERLAKPGAGKGVYAGRPADRHHVMAGPFERGYRVRTDLPGSPYNCDSRL